MIFMFLLLLFKNRFTKKCYTNYNEAKLRNWR